MKIFTRFFSSGIMLAKKQLLLALKMKYFLLSWLDADLIQHHSFLSCHFNQKKIVFLLSYPFIDPIKDCHQGSSL